jgi:hypothetical protein
MGLTLAIDPGIVGCGCAILGEDSELIEAFFVKNPNTTAETSREEGTLFTDLTEAIRLRVSEVTALCPERVVIERPQVYVTHAAPPEDVMVVGVLVGALLQLWMTQGAREVSLVVPRRWKRQVPKKIMLQRIEQRLSDEERTRIKESRSTFRHNVLDAVGLGKWYAGNGR